MSAVQAREMVIQVAGRQAGLLRRLPSAGAARPALLLVHGAGDNQHCFDELIAALPPDLDLIIPALPGRDASDGPAVSSAADAALWLRQLVAALGLARLVVAGYSCGGAVALEYALAEAQLRRIAPDAPALAGLVLIATGARLRVTPALLKAAEQAARDHTHVPIQRSHFRAETDPELVRRVHARRALTPPTSAHADWLLADAFDRMAELNAVSARTLVLAGAQDELTPLRYAQYLAQHIPHAELQVFEQAGHFFPVEQPGMLAARLDAFIARL